ncbi:MULTISPECIES: TfoX/Sxy family protein [Odoribacteraceae]|uniref:TfoX/Sxy family protein n=1 Tax=Odoribacteraceae TaxID=1853231 RepID=UPI000E4844FC|nr:MULTISPECIES: TfoX/Sxy family protein [Odoribacteraceae]MCQ4873774.1 TfoX/Sxy family protein [Butyricimonas paravirosa]RHR79620.1 competence protein TfoX [Odoribacter sp. AF15-53]
MKLRISSDLRKAKNIGATIEKCLNEIGIFTLADLAEMTSVEAFKRIRENYPGKTIPVCYYLYSLEGALLDLHWNDIPSELKEELKARIKSYV